MRQRAAEKRSRRHSPGHGPEGRSQPSGIFSIAPPPASKIGRVGGKSRVHRDRGWDPDSTFFFPGWHPKNPRTDPPTTAHVVVGFSGSSRCSRRRPASARDSCPCRRIIYCLQVDAGLAGHIRVRRE